MKPELSGLMYLNSEGNHELVAYFFIALWAVSIVFCAVYLIQCIRDEEWVGAVVLFGVIAGCIFMILLFTKLLGIVYETWAIVDYSKVNLGEIMERYDIDSITKTTIKLRLLVTGK